MPSKEGASRLRAAAHELVGDVPRLATVGNMFPNVPDEAPPQFKRGMGGRASPKSHLGLNLPAVAEVLASYGMDPAEELAKVLNATEPVLDRSGKPVIDPDTLLPMTKPVLDTETRVKLMTELMQYTRPKLKAVEVTVKEPELTDEQIDKRLQPLLEKLGKKA